MEDYPTVEKHLNERIFLHKWCLGEEDAQLGGRQFYTYDTIFSKLGHTTVELLKMDIEGYEWDVYNSFQPSNQASTSVKSTLAVVSHLRSVSAQRGKKYTSNICPKTSKNVQTWSRYY